MNEESSLTSLDADNEKNKSKDDSDNQDTRTATVKSVEAVHLQEPVKVYNFEVADSHTYYVGEQGVLVHNVCGPDVGDGNGKYARSGESVANKGGSSSVDVDLKYKESWTAAQKSEADAKIKALTEANTVKTPATRRGTSASSRYKSAYGKNSVPQG